MLTPRLTTCTECVDILSLIEQADCKIAELAKCEYNKIIFAMNTSCDTDKLFTILNYKRILLNRYYNPEYANSFSLDAIGSRMKILIVGAKCNCIKKAAIFDITTTTTTTAAVTTTTTTTVSSYAFYIGYFDTIGTAEDACNGTFTNYYGNMSDMSDIINFRLYTDPELTTFAPNGYYCLAVCSGGLSYGYIFVGPVNPGKISTIVSCV